MATTKRPSRKQAKLMERAIKIVHDCTKDSEFFGKNQIRDLPVFDLKEIVVGKQLGEGEFGVVREVTEFDYSTDNCTCRRCARKQKEEEEEEKKSYSDVNEEAESGHRDLSHYFPSIYGGEGFDEYLSDLDDEDFDEDGDIDQPIEDRCFMKKKCIRKGDARYAIKNLKKTLTDGTRGEAIVDLAIEAKFLAALSHPNIIKMRGTGKVPCHPSFFLVLDRLYETLQEKIDFWREEEERFKGKLFGLVKKQKAEMRYIWRDRLLAAYDVARAMKYLHTNNILFRDLKPDNVGFDVRGTAKIFDFGLVKELLPKDKIKDDEYKASGLTGSRRYMSPEVAQCSPYGKPADVYSFSIMTWEVCALKIPFDGYDCEKHDKLVVRKGKRPKISTSWPKPFQSLLRESWSADTSRRPTFDKVCDLLRVCLLLAEKDDHSYVADRTKHLMDRSNSSRGG